MRIAFVIENVPRAYSGGRVHGWLIIQALMALGHEVKVYTEGKPPFYAAVCRLAGEPKMVIKRPLSRLGVSRPVDMVCSFPILATAWADREARRLGLPHAAWVLDPRLMCKKYAPAVASRMHYGDSYRAALRAADWIVASDDAAVPFIRQWTGHRQIVPWTPSINSIVADEARRYVPGREARSVVAITRTTEHKNWPHVVDALRAVSCTATVLTSFDVSKMRLSVKRAGLQNRVTVVDKPDEWQKFQAFWSASVFLSASQYEGLGLPQMEALYTGCRPVVYDFPVMREICGSVGLYAKWRDVGSLTGMLREALGRPRTSAVLDAGKRYGFAQMLKRAPKWTLR